MKEEIDKLTGAIGDTLKTAPTLYEDALQPTVQEVGKIIARIPRAINAAFSNLDKWILYKENNIEEIKKLLAKKLENIDPDKIVTPEIYIAIPTIQAISYSMNNEILQDLYTNLLAKAMNFDTKDFVHPSYIEIIKQMSPVDALVFKKIMETPIRPLITISQDFSESGKWPIFENCSWIQDISLQQCRMSFSCLARLGLIEIPTGVYSNDDVYNSVRQNPLFIEADELSLSKIQNGNKCCYEKHFIKTNELSNSFYITCITN